MQIRTEKSSDWPAVYSLHTEAFPTAAEAKLVNRLRASAHPLISLVAEAAGKIVGHILFTPVTLPDTSLLLMGLAPLAVAASQQSQGIGGALIKAGLASCERLDVAAVFVLGHAEYYPRFGFVPTAPHNIQSEYDAPAENFMLLELHPNSLAGSSGTIRYHQEFSAL